MVDIRPLQSSDQEAFIALLREMDEHWGDDISSEKRAQYVRRWQEEFSDMMTLIALNGERVVSFATLVPMFPGRACDIAWFLKELYVSSSFRGQSLGERMMRACAQAVVERGGSRLDLTVDDTNSGAFRFYERLGAKDTRKTTLRWADKELEDLAS